MTNMYTMLQCFLLRVFFLVFPQIESLENSRKQILEEKTKLEKSMEETQATLATCQKDLEGNKQAFEKEQVSSKCLVTSWKNLFKAPCLMISL